MMKKLVSQVSRTGRDLQRYNFQGCRQVVGCIPYRLRNNEESISIDGMDQLEFLLISSQKSSKWMFPKGGWEEDETIEEAAVRETMEEAGVLGIVGIQLGNWTFKSKSQDKHREGYMLSFRVTDELDVWPEKDTRKRIWVTASEAREKCEYLWMKMALDSFICRVNQCQTVDDEFKISVFSSSLKVDEPTVDITTQSEEEEEEEEGDLDCHIVSLEQLQLKEENYLTPYLIRRFRSNEPTIRIVAQAEEENALSQLAQMTHLRLIQEDERRKPCCLDFLKSKESRFVIQSGEEDAIISQ